MAVTADIMSLLVVLKQRGSCGASKKKLTHHYETFDQIVLKNFLLILRLDSKHCLCTNWHCNDGQVPFLFNKTINKKVQ